MKKPQIIVTSLLVCIALALLLLTIPVYPDFRKEAGSYGHLKQVMDRDTGTQLPTQEQLHLQNLQCFYQLSGRTLTSQPIGYLLKGTGSVQDVELVCSIGGVEGMTAAISADETYRDVAVSVAFPQSGLARMVQVVSVFGGCTYTLEGIYVSPDGRVAEADRYLEGYLKGICHNLIDRSL